MSALYASIEPTDDPDFVSVRTSATPNPERKPSMLVRRDHLDGVLLMLLDAAGSDVNHLFDTHNSTRPHVALGVANRSGA